MPANSSDVSPEKSADDLSEPDSSVSRQSYKGRPQFIPPTTSAKATSYRADSSKTDDQWVLIQAESGKKPDSDNTDDSDD